MWAIDFCTDISGGLTFNDEISGPVIVVTDVPRAIESNCDFPFGDLK